MTGAAMPGAWTARANCLGANPSLFFAEDQSDGATTQQAKRICAGCQVREECLRFAIETFQPVGVWGGKSTRERQPRHLRRVEGLR